MTAGRLDSYLHDTAAIGDVSDLMGYFENFITGYGFSAICYAVLYEDAQPLDVEIGLIYHTFPMDLVDRYIDKQWIDIDPVVALVPRVSVPFRWSDVGRYIDLTEDQRAFMSDFASFGVREGLAVPVFTKRGDTAYFSFGCKSDTLELSETEITELQLICQQTHLRYLALAGTVRRDTVVLSPREKEVLYWIAQGKSNSVIADILSISEHTVDTLVRRCFSKLGVSNRVSAAVRGVLAGIIDS